MKRIIKDTDNKRLFTVLLMIILMCFTFVAYKVYAVEVTPEMESRGPGVLGQPYNGPGPGTGEETDIGQTGYLTLNDLRERYEIFCCSHGTPLNGAARATLVTEKGSLGPEEVGKLLPDSVGKQAFRHTVNGADTSTPFLKGTYTHRTYGKYEVSSIITCTPMEAYILAEMLNNLPYQTNAGVVFVGDENGNKIEYTGEIDDSTDYMDLGGTVVYIVHLEDDDGAGNEIMVMQDTDGKYYQVKDGNDEGWGISSYVQRAWWNTEAVTAASTKVPENSLTIEARAFETYIKRIAKSSDPKDFVDVTVEINGETVTVPAPEIEYKPEFHTSETYKDKKNGIPGTDGTPTGGGDILGEENLNQIKVLCINSENKYRIGPFSVNYIEAGCSTDNRNPIQFAGITDAKLYTDASEEPLVRGEDWNFYWLDGQRDVNEDTYEFPHEDEIFYIEIYDKKINGKTITQITDIAFDFQYMNAGGKYEELKGTYYDVTWKAKEEANYCEGCDDESKHEDGATHIVSTDYWVELTSFSAPKESQQLAGGLIGARWYEKDITLHRKLNIRYAKIIVYKDLVDDAGNKITPEKNVYFDIAVTVSGTLNDVSNKKMRIKAGTSLEAGVYYWLADNANPTYEVKEINIPDGYELVSIKNGSGNLNEYEFKSVPVEIANKVSKIYEGSLKIKKVLSKFGIYGTIDQKPTFTFDAIISTKNGSFEYNGTKYDSTKSLKIEGIQIAGEGEWKLEDLGQGTIKWKEGADNPTYVVSERQTEGYILEKMENGSGTITPNTEGIATVIATNAPDRKKAKININKVLEYDKDLYSEEDLKLLNFSFLIDVENYGKELVVLKPERENEKFVWKYSSGEYVWQGEKGLAVKITEISIPEGWAFEGAEIPEGWSFNKENAEISGTLKEAKDVNLKITNKDKNTPKTTQIEITKIIDSKKLENKDYKFALIVEGTFKYHEAFGVKVYKNQRVQITNDSSKEMKEGYDKGDLITIRVESMDSVSKWTSAKFEWSGKAPTYTVEEDLIGEDIVNSINPSKGDFTEAQDGLIKIVAENYITSKQGYLRIIKKLKDTDKCSVDYIKRLEFKFDVKVNREDGTVIEDRIITLKPEKAGDEWVWQTELGPYKWAGSNNPKEKAPTYKVTEVEPLPAGTEFDHIEVPEGQEATISGMSVSGQIIECQLDEYEQKPVLDFTDCYFFNKLGAPKQGYITIRKEVTDKCLINQTFLFNVNLKGFFSYNGEYQDQNIDIEASVTVGENLVGETKIGPISWYGEAIDAPDYIITEKPNEFAKIISMTGDSGKVIEGETGATFTAINEPEYYRGNLKVEKIVEGAPKSNKEFEIKITIDGVTKTVFLKANETAVSDFYEWPKILGEDAGPEYKVEEVDGEKYHCTIDNAEGRIKPGTEEVKVKVKNTLDKNTGKFSVKKEVVGDKKLIDMIEVPTFDITIKITGIFEYEGQIFTDETLTIKTNIKMDETKEYTVSWWDDEAPTVEVDEDESTLQPGWKRLGISNNNIELEKDENLEIVVTNAFEPTIIIKITMKLAGDVWVDTPENIEDKNTGKDKPNGVFDEWEKGVPEIEVYIYDSNGNLATIFDENGVELTQPVITSASGHWEVPGVKANDGPYYAEFIYDGQTYEPTEALVTSKAKGADAYESRGKIYRDASTSDRDEWANDSMALDIDREEVNARLETISGKADITGERDTIGTATSKDGSQFDLIYEGNFNAGSNRTSSELVTLEKTGRVKEPFKTKANTNTLGLTYPFDDRIHLESFDTKLVENELQMTYKYSATYNYTLHINLGLIERPEVDLEIVKDLESAKVAVNDKVLEYRFNRISDIGKKVLNRSELDSYNIRYELGLYSTDYYYRAELYKANSNYQGYDRLEEFYKAIYGNEAMDPTELEVYLRYKITLYSASATDYKVKVKSVDDYFDSSFGAPISEKIEKYVAAEKEGEPGKKVTVADKSTVVYSNGNAGGEVTWDVANIENNIKGSDGVTYNKVTARDLDIELGNGEYATIYVTFSVKKATVDGVHESIILGEKSNVAEIASYSTLDKNGNIAGKVDRDSAPDNANIRSYNDKPYYDDDTDSAPVLDIKLESSNREIKGIAWEDDKNNKDTIGIRDENEALIGGLTTTLVEKVTVDNVDYDFIWPTHVKLSSLGERTLESLTGFDSITETSRTKSEEDKIEVGQYHFKGIPEGNYVVRFIYGNEKSDYLDTFGITGQAQALDKDGKPVAKVDKDEEGNESNNVLPANYNEGLTGYIPAVYNGQDYKTTEYQKGFDTLSNAWYDLNNESLAAALVSDARDSEARRLEVMAQSREITNVNGNVLMTANGKDDIHTELYGKYSMFADTAKIKLYALYQKTNESLDIANEELKGIETNYINITTKDANSDNIEGVTPVKIELIRANYLVDKVDIGLIKRPENDIVLDKQIGEIKLITNTRSEDVIFDAKYNISYEEVRGNQIGDRDVVAKLDDNKYLVAKVELNESSIATDLMQSIDKWESKLGYLGENQDGTKNFRFINVDDEIMQGLTIKLDYILTALNVGECDYTTTEIENMEDITDPENKLSVRQQLLDLAEKARIDSTNPDTIEYGKYIGKYYYTGNKEGLVVSTSKVRQLVEYVDNDAIFEQDENNTENHSWKNTTITELMGNGFESERLVDKAVTQELQIVDVNNIGYISQQKNNVLLSIDYTNTDVALSNAGFEAKLVPYEYYVEQTNEGATDVPNYKSKIQVTVSKTVGVDEDGAGNLSFDNVAEIVKYESAVGRRDEITIPGNVSPKFGEFEAALVERDSSATELVTFTPPTGLAVQTGMTMQILLAVAGALVILAVGIVIIKKKVLK